MRCLTSLGWRNFAVLVWTVAVCAGVVGRDVVATSSRLWVAWFLAGRGAGESREPGGSRRDAGWIAERLVAELLPQRKRQWNGSLVGEQSSRTWTVGGFATRPLLCFGNDHAQDHIRAPAGGWRITRGSSGGDSSGQEGCGNLGENGTADAGQDAIVWNVSAAAGSPGDTRPGETRREV